LVVLCVPVILNMWEMEYRVVSFSIATGIEYDIIHKFYLSPPQPALKVNFV
jgi:hypothetical protein